MSEQTATRGSDRRASNGNGGRFSFTISGGGVLVLVSVLALVGPGLIYVGALSNRVVVLEQHKAEDDERDAVTHDATMRLDGAVQRLDVKGSENRTRIERLEGPLNQEDRAVVRDRARERASR